MRGLPSILMIFRNEFDKLSNTATLNYHMTILLIWNLILTWKRKDFFYYARNVVMDVIK